MLLNNKERRRDGKERFTSLLVKSAVNQLTEDSTGTHALQLVHFTDQDNSRTHTDTAEELPCQPHIDHGAIVHDDEVGVKRFFLLILLDRSTVAQKPLKAVQRFGVVSTRAFCHSSAGSSGRSGKQDLPFGVEHLKDLYDRPQDCGFTGTGRACDDRQITAKSHIHRLALPL